jgi:hypothetical protein
MIWKTRKLVKERSILSSINPPAVADAVKELYCSDEVAE